MNRSKHFVRLIAVGALLCAASAFANGNITMTLTGAGANNIMGGYYVNPYDGRITYPDNTQINAQILCDDFFATNYIGQTWNVTELTVGSLTRANIGQTRWGQGLTTDAQRDAMIQRYQQAAYLATQLVSTTNLTDQGRLSFALWGLFTPQALNSISGMNREVAEQLINDVRAMTFAAGSFANVSIFTPTPLNGPQEMLVVRTPEPGTIALLLINALFGVGIVVWSRRRVAARQS